MVLYGIAYSLFSEAVKEAFAFSREESRKKRKIEKERCGVVEEHRVRGFAGAFVFFPPSHFSSLMIVSNGRVTVATILIMIDMIDSIDSNE